MSQRLQEFKAEKTLKMMEKLFRLMGKKLHTTFEILPIPTIYRNAWGEFIGYPMFDNKRKIMYRINFSRRGGYDSIVSIDRYKKNERKYEKPEVTLSLCGFGIARVFNQILDWLKGLDLNEAFILKEAGSNQVIIKRWLVDTIANGTNWADLVASGKKDISEAKRAFIEWVKIQAQSDSLINPKILAKLGATNFSKILQRVWVELASTSKDGLIPLVEERKGIIEKDKDVSDELLMKLLGSNFSSTANDRVKDALQSAAEASLGADYTIEKYKEAIHAIFDEDDNAPAGIIGWGEGGTGKTYHAVEALKEMGVNPHPITIQGKAISGINGLISFLYTKRKEPLLVVDDADSTLFSKDDVVQSIWKNALQTDKDSRWVSVPKVRGKTLNDLNGDPIVDEKFLVETSFIFISNINPYEELDRATLTRFEVYSFNFTPEEKITMVNNQLDKLAQSVIGEYITKQDCRDINQLLALEFLKEVNDPSIKEVNKLRYNFRLVLQCFYWFWRENKKGRNGLEEISKRLKASKRQDLATAIDLQKAGQTS